MSTQPRWMALAALAALAAACNMVTGADQLRLADDDDSGSSGAGRGPGFTSAGGSGLASGNGGAMVASGAGGSTSQGGAPPTDCDYPPGPYGVSPGQVIPPTLSWQGYAPGASQPSIVTPADFFDCDGSRGIDAVVFDTSQYG